MLISNLFKPQAFFFKILLRRLRDVSRAYILSKYNYILFIFLDYMLCHPFLNKLIEFNFDFYDEELVDIYVSFIKSLALLLNENSI
jgi:hypothetical protein